MDHCVANVHSIITNLNNKNYLNFLVHNQWTLTTQWTINDLKIQLYIGQYKPPILYFFGLIRNRVDEFYTLF